MKHIALILFFLPMAAFAAGDTSACSTTESHASQRACLISMSEKADARLAKIEADSLSLIKGWGEDVSYRTKSRRALASSNESFRKYRVAQCGLVHSLAAGGNGATDMQLECSIELANQRIAQLSSYVRSLEPVVQYAAAHPDGARKLKGKRYTSVRRKVMKDGWIPFHQPDPYMMGWGNEIRRKFPELEDCAGDRPVCSFSFMRSGKCLRIFTSGEEAKDLKVYSVAHECPQEL